MVVAASTHPTLIDWANRENADKTIADIIEVIAEVNELTPYIPWIKCNDGSRHETTIRSGLPTPTWVGLYDMVQPTKSQTTKVYDATGIMETYSEISVKLAKRNGMSEAWMRSEEAAFIQGMNEEFMQTFFYGNEGTEPEAFTGLSSRYNSTSAENGLHVITEANANTSMWLLTFGDRALHGIYPDGFEMGLSYEDKGQVTDNDGSGGRLELFRGFYQWACGISLRDWRSCGRIQTDYSSLTVNAATGMNLYDELSKMITRTKKGAKGQRVIACNEGVLEFLRLQAKYGTASRTLRREELAGQMVDTIDGIPVVCCDALTYTETTIT
jgi:hypothetical protein